MQADKMLEWTESGEANPPQMYWQWDEDAGRFAILNEPWRIVGPGGLSHTVPDAIWIDRLFFGERFVALADWRSRKLWLFEPASTSLEAMPLPEPADIAAMQTDGDAVWLLVRSQAQVLRLDAAGTVRQRLGTRLSFPSERRLGFEWPDDMLVSADGLSILVCDSGNRRLLRIDTASARFRSFPVPLSPRFILHDGPDGWLLSDGADTLIWGTDRYGAMRVDRDQPMNCCRIMRRHGQVFGSDESGRWGQLTIRPPSLRPERLQPLVRLAMQIEAGQGDIGGLLAGLDAGALSEMLRYSDRGSALAAHLNRREFLLPFLPEPWNNLADLEKQAVALQQLNQQIDTSSDPESLRVERAALGYRIKKSIGETVAALRQWREMTRRLESLSEEPSCALPMIEEFIAAARDMIGAVRRELADWQGEIDAQALTRQLVRYTLARRVIEEMGRDLAGERITLFDRSLVNAVEALTVIQAELYLKRGNIEQFKACYQSAINTHPDWTSLPLSYIDKLFTIGDLDAIDHRLRSMSNQQQENQHARLSVLFQQRGDLTNAAVHLRKELDLFPHRLDLIVPLLEIAQVDEKELQDRLSRAMVGRQGQIDTNYHLGRIFLKRGQTDKALDCFISECELFPESSNALLEIKEIFFTHPDVKFQLTEAKAERIWSLLKQYLDVRKQTAPLPDGIPILLFVLNYIALTESDENWLRDSLDRISSPDWLSLVRAHFRYRSLSGKAFEHFGEHNDELAAMLEQISCREALARELLNDPQLSAETRRIIGVRYPEALPFHDNSVPLRLDLSSGFHDMRQHFPFSQAGIVADRLLFVRKGLPELRCIETLTDQEEKTLYTFSGKESVWWFTHRRLQTILLWDQGTLKEYSVSGRLLAEQPLAERPFCLLRHPSGYIAFTGADQRVNWSLWRTSQGFSDEFQPCVRFPQSLSGVSYDDGTGLSWTPNGEFWRFQDGVFRLLFQRTIHRFTIRNCCYWPECQVFICLEGCKGITTPYLSLFDEQGMLLQRILLPWTGVDWLGLTNDRRLLFGQQGHWLGGVSASYSS